MLRRIITSLSSTPHPTVEPQSPAPLGTPGNVDGFERGHPIRANPSPPTPGHTASLVAPVAFSKRNDVLQGRFAQLRGWTKTGNVQTLVNPDANANPIVRLTSDGKQGSSISKSFDLSHLQGKKIALEYSYNVSRQGVLRHSHTYSTDDGKISINSTGSEHWPCNQGSIGSREPFVAGTATQLTVTFTVDAAPLSLDDAGSSIYADIENLTITPEP